MAEFSKQYCDIYEPEINWDFDIDEVVETIPKGHYKPIICEGFGFSGIGVRLDGSVEILVRDRTDEDNLVQIDYRKYIALHKSKLEKNG
jgi:hypothetical protein